MKFLKKIKEYLFSEETELKKICEDAQDDVEGTEEVLQEAEQVAQDDVEHIAPNDQGELLGVCPHCNLNMYSEHKITSLSGNKLHRTCFKDMKRQRKAEMGL